MEQEITHKRFSTFYLPPDPSEEERASFLEDLATIFDDLTFTYRGILVTHSEDEVVLVRMPPDHEEDLE